MAALHLAEDVAWAAAVEVFFGDFEAVGGLFEDGEFLACFLVVFVDEEDAVGGVGAASDASAELVELGESEAVGVVDEHDGGVGDVDADFDDGGGDEGVDVVLAEVLDDVVFGVAVDASVEECDLVGFESFGPGLVSAGGGLGVDFFGVFDEGVDEVDLASLVELGFEEGGDVFEFVVFADGGDDFAAVLWAFGDGGDVEVAVEGEGEGAWDGGGGHDEDVGGVGVLLDEFGALGDAEFVLFVDDGEVEVWECGVCGVEEGVGADGEVWEVLGELLEWCWVGGGVGLVGDFFIGGA